MTRFRLAIFLGFLCCTGIPAQAFQSDRLDSLEKVYEDYSRSDSVRFRALQELTFSLIFSDGVIAKEKIKEGLLDAEKKFGKTRVYFELLQNLGIYYDVNQQTDSSFEIFSQILEESKKNGWLSLQE